MIKINLKDDYFDESIKCIFQRLSKYIIKKIGVVDVELFDDSNNIIEINEENIYQFLVSKRFYKYKYRICDDKVKITDEIISDWLKLPCGFATSSLYNPRANSNMKYREFHKNYSSTFEDFFNKLEVFRQENKNIKSENKSEFIKEYYPSYYTLVNAFSYDLLTGDERDIIVSKMNVNVCPYCNMNYTLNFINNSRIKASADLDHFYVKSSYPMYTLCLYNFIPSCPICNSRLKLDKIMTIESHIYPHYNSFAEDGVFEISNLSEYLVDECDHIIIKLNNSTKDSKISNSNELFQIEQRYKYFEPIAKELLNKTMTYNELYQKEIRELLGDITSVDIKNLIFGKKLTEEEILNESLGKFRMDLLKNLRIF